MPKNFAKLFEFDDIGQVLVVMNTEEPEFSSSLTLAPKA